MGREKGSPRRPLGAILDEAGVAFSLHSAHATAVELCLFDGSRRETRRVSLSRGPDGTWRTRVEGARSGQPYGYRVSGPYDPIAGHRFNPNKLLVDPYARALEGTVRWDDALYGFDPASPDGDLSFDGRNSAPFVPLSVVTDEAFDWSGDRAPGHALADTVIYEAHVRGLTRLHPEIPGEIRGTYEALDHPAIIEHLRRVGATAIELLPIGAFVDDRFLARRGLVNYWGYSPLAYFAPEPRYFGPRGAAGLKAAVAALHRAGIEVILDVVFNHTCEAEETGPTLSFRGIDNATYYKPLPGDPRRTLNPTGCGNALDLSQPAVSRLVLDALRHWVEAYHVDGFRFDLAATLARNPYEFDTGCAFLADIRRDSVLADVKLIAEAWDVGPGGYQVGRFPPGWSDWNDRFRDGLRTFWRGDEGAVPGLAQALSGSREIFEASGRGPDASLNYVCSHDGFTLADLAACTARRNEANGEGNRDGHAHEFSLNHGVEGPTDDPAITAARQRHARNLLATLMLSMGVPMIGMGDEAGRSQGGNNNPYCQDNETTWMDWSALPDPDLVDFVAALARLRRSLAHPRRTTFLTGRPDPENGSRDVIWLRPDGGEMEPANWADPTRRTLGMLTGEADEQLFLVCHAGDETITFRLPLVSQDEASRPFLPGGEGEQARSAARGGDTSAGQFSPRFGFADSAFPSGEGGRGSARWSLLLSTDGSHPTSDGVEPVFRPGGTFTVEARSLHLFRATDHTG